MSMMMPPLGTYSAAPIEWAEVETQLQTAFNYWLSTTRPTGAPHAVPIWGLWHEGAFYFYTEPQTQKVKNLTAHPDAVLLLESAEDVVIVEGPTTVVPPGSAEWAAVDAGLFAKYKDPASGIGLRLTDAPHDPVVYKLHPRHVRAWAGGNCFAQAHWHFG